MSKLFSSALLALASFCVTQTLYAADQHAQKNSVSKQKNLTVIASSFAISQPLRELSSVNITSTVNHSQNIFAKLPGKFKLLPGQKDTAIQTFSGLPLPTIPGISMLGLGRLFVGPSGPFNVPTSPADPNLSVGPHHVVQAVNESIAVFNKFTGGVISGPTTLQSLWAALPSGRCAGKTPAPTGINGDPVVKYDRLADRWIIIAQSTEQSEPTPPNSVYAECLAVSQTPDPSGPYFLFEFDFPPGLGIDYGKLGVWPDAYYMSFIAFQGPEPDLTSTVAPVGFTNMACALERSKLLFGNPAARIFCSHSYPDVGFLPGDLDGARLPPPGSPDYYVGFGNSNTTLGIWKFHIDWNNLGQSFFQGPTLLNVKRFSQFSVDKHCANKPETNLNCVPQRGTLDRLDVGDNRMMFRLAYRNFGTHASLVVNHTVNADNVTGIRWYEIRINNQGTPGVYQQGTYSQPDGNFRWYGSIAMDKLGNMALGFNASGMTLFPAIRYTGRLFLDPVNTMRAEGSIMEGNGSQLKPTTGDMWNRWDDYTSMAIDPSDDCTFWYTAEYMTGTAPLNFWSTYIGSFKFSTCR